MVKFKRGREREEKYCGYLMCVSTGPLFVQTTLFYDKGTERF